MKQKQQKTSRYHWMALLVALIALTGCTMTLPATPGATPSGTTPGDATPTTTSGGESDPLASTSWQLTGLGTTDTQTPLVADSTVTLEFGTNGQVGGNAGCNSFGGSYTVDGETIMFSELISTLMACADNNVMEQEQQYLAALNSADRFAVDGGQLMIWYDNDNGLLTFTAGTMATPAPANTAATATPATATTPQPTATAAPTTDGTNDPSGYPPSEPTRINFGAGETSAEVDGHLAAGARDYYVLSAQAGQNMSVAITSPNDDVLLAVVGEDGTPYKRYENGGPSWSFTLPTTQDYYIEAVSTGAATDYTVHVSISPLDGGNTGDFPPTDATRINFDPGTTSATINGSIAERATDFYVLQAQAGQVMSVDITSPNNNVLLTVVGEDGTPYKRYQNGPPSWSYTLPATQDYYIEAVSVGPATDYTLRVWIEPLDNSGSAERVEFAPGETSASRSGALAEGGVKEYILTANAGQMMHVQTVGYNAPVEFTIRGPGGGSWSGEAQGSEVYIYTAQVTLPSDGDYVVSLTVPANKGATRYDVTFTIDGSAGQPATPSPTTAERIEFAPGATSAERRGLLPSGPGTLQYVLTANEGQTMTVDATSDGTPLSMTIADPTGFSTIPEMREVQGGYTIGAQFVLPATGDYVVTLQKGDHTPSTNYTVTFTIQ